MGCVRANLLRPARFPRVRSAGNPPRSECCAEQWQLPVDGWRIAAATVQHSIQTVVGSLQTALAEIEQALGDWREHNPSLDEQADRLDTLPGVGPKTVLPLLALLVRWDG